jgi:hypothetical protein
MIVAIIIIAYVLNVFLNRWLNKLIYKYDRDPELMIGVWFIPIVSTLFFLIVLIILSANKDTNWFTGKYW